MFAELPPLAVYALIATWDHALHVPVPALVVTNLANVFSFLGRGLHGAAGKTHDRLGQPLNPFTFFDLGLTLAAMKRVFGKRIVRDTTTCAGDFLLRYSVDARPTSCGNRIQQAKYPGAT